MFIAKLFSHNRALLVSFSLLLVSSLGLWLILRPPHFSFLNPAPKSGALELLFPQTITLNQPFTASIEVYTNNQPVNATGLYLRFDPQKLQLLDLDTRQSFCQFYPEKKFDNHQGTVTLACGSPHPGFTGKNVILKLKFMPIAVGKTTVFVDPKSQLLLSNGQGTNILTDDYQHTFNILPSI